MTASKAGGLHNDELHKYIREYYSSSNDEKVRKEMSQRKIPGNQPNYAETILDVPRPENGYVATVLYGDRNGLHVNERATSIARACGWLSKLVYGDAFITRSFDRNEDEWPW